MSDDLYMGPSVLAPGAPKDPDRIARLIVWPLLLLLFALTIVFYILFSPLQVVGDSMEPNLLNKDRVLRTKTYGEPRAGDVVIVDTGTSAPDDDIVKRVIAVAGDTIEIRDDVAVVNGSAEPTAGLLLLPGRGENRPPVVVPEGYVYVMGDNRPVSLDSRFVGPLLAEKVRGRALFVFLPTARFGPIE